VKPVDVDIDDILEDIASVLYERETGRSQTFHSEVRETEDVVYLLPGAWQNIADSLLSLDQSLAPLEEGPGEGEARRQDGIEAPVKRLAKRMILKVMYWYVNPVIAQLHRMHAATDRALHEIADQLRSVNDRLESLEKDKLEDRVGALEGERFDQRIGRLERSWRQAVDSDTATGSLVQGAFSEVQLRGVGKDRVVPVERSGAVPPFHFDYYWFESIHRGDRELIKSRLQPYLEHFSGCENVLDIGCGRGEFLELMAEKGIGACGIDLESDAIQLCNDAGLKAEQAEAIEHLAGLPDDSLDGVFISQVAEHMTPSELIELVGLAFQKMSPGGYIVVETPNPQCLLIFASFFYADLSHVQPIHPETMRFLLLSAGFRDVEIKMMNPVPKNQRLSRIVTQGKGPQEPWLAELNSNLEKLNSVLFSHMDYAAVARK